MIAFVKYTLMSTALMAFVLALLAAVQYLDEQDALRTVVASRSL